ncbi:hypothetical protein J3R82DRAFT_6718 [Butyriboletus roseoflavus]|nr:hypothetical protein J3R82DRAFT_6718 [Butyriboletus roseoflavus]
MPTTHNAKGTGRVVHSFLTYLNHFAAWSFHAFPCNLSEDFPYTPDTTAVASLQDLACCITVQPGLKVKLTWDALNISVIAHLAANENENLIVKFMKAYSFTVIQDHTVVLGKSMYAWVPLISTASIQVKERQCDAPVGCIYYSQGTGNKMIIQYSEVTKDIKMSVLGEVKAQYAMQLKQVRKAVLKNTFAANKKNIMIKVEVIPYGA